MVRYAYFAYWTTAAVASLEPAVERVETRLERVAGALPLYGIALLVVVLAWLVSRWVARWDRPYRRLRGNQFVGDLTRGITRALILITGLVIALEILDATHIAGALLGTAGVAGLALGFAFRDLIENYVASVLLSLRQPFAPNDHVRIEGFEGKVARLTTRATILITPDGNNLRIPNATVFKGIILNFTRNPLRRFGFPVEIHAETDIARAQAALLRVLAETEGVLGTPAPAVVVEQLAAAHVRLGLYGWVDQTHVDFGTVQSDAMRRTRAALNAAGVRAPEPVYRLRTDAAVPPDVDGYEPAAARRAQPAAPRVPSRPPPQPPQPPHPKNLAPSVDLDHQISRDRAESRTPDLLDPKAPLE